MQMKAAVYHECGEAERVLRVVDLPIPEPGPNQALVAVHASGINPHDTKKRAGWLKPDIPTAGFIPHSDGAGIVSAIGPGCDPGWLNKRVFFGGAPAGFGTAAEYCLIPANHVFSLPEAMSFAEGAALGVPAFTAWLCTLAHGSLAGLRVLVHGGSGAVGRVAVEMAALAGAEVIATAGGSERASIPRRRQAAHVVDYGEFTDPQDMAARILELTDGEGIDHVIDVDFAAHISCNAKILRPNGRLCSYSSTSDRNPVFPYYDFALKGITLHLTQATILTSHQRTEAGRAICGFLAQNKLRPDISDCFPLTNIAHAHTLVEHGQADANVILRLKEHAGGDGW